MDHILNFLFLLPVLLLALSGQAFSETIEGLPNYNESPFVKSEQRNPFSSDEEFKLIPLDQYFGGGAAGFTIGFGVGHAIQGRYSEKGWIFTVGEGVALALFIYSQYKDEKQMFTGDLFSSSFHMSSNNRLTTLAFLTFIGFKVWEKIDVWMLPSNYKIVKESPFQIKPVAFYDPSAQFHYGMSLNYLF